MFDSSICSSTTRRSAPISRIVANCVRHNLLLNLIPTCFRGLVLGEDQSLYTSPTRPPLRCQSYQTLLRSQRSFRQHDAFGDGSDSDPLPRPGRKEACADCAYTLFLLNTILLSKRYASQIPKSPFSIVSSQPCLVSLLNQELWFKSV